MNKVAVTGATGMIGRHIVQLLLARGVTVRALVRRVGFLPEGVAPVLGSLESPEALRSLLEGVDTVFHCAAELHDSRVMHASNVDGTERLAAMANNLRVGCFVHLSSAGVVGPASEPWIDENTPCNPMGAYEVSKFEAESALIAMAKGKMRLCMLRPTNVIDEDHPGVLRLLLEPGLKSHMALLFKGKEVAHLIHAEDVAAAALHLADFECCSGVYFVACDEDLRNTLAGVARICGPDGGMLVWPNLSLSPGISNCLRRIARGKSLHGRSRFSSAQIIATGFEFRVGLEQAVRRICSTAFFSGTWK